MSEAKKTPSQRIIEQADKNRTVTDSDGRVIIWRPLSILDQAKLFRAIGGEHADNLAFSRLAAIAAGVASIDGVPCPAPVNLNQVDAAIGRLGDNGYQAILTLFANAEDAEDVESMRKQAKN